MHQVPIRVLIADDHVVVREGLAALFCRETDMVVAGEACNGLEAVQLFRQLRPDIVLMDLRMPEMDGIQALAVIRAEFPSARVIVLTVYDDEEYIARSVRAGAKAFLLKSGPREELLDAVRRVHSGQTYFPFEVAEKMAARMAGRDLTERERQVLELLAAGKSNQEIGSILSVSESTVKAHVNKIFSKLHVCDRTQAVTAGLKRGIVSLP